MTARLCPDCVTCHAAGCRETAYCLADPLRDVPCETWPYCMPCALELCEECQERAMGEKFTEAAAAERAMFTARVYDEDADQLYRPEHAAPPFNPGAFCPTHNRPRKACQEYHT
jgi:hypothetical protein